MLLMWLGFLILRRGQFLEGRVREVMIRKIVIFGRVLLLTKVLLALKVKGLESKLIGF